MYKEKVVLGDEIVTEAYLNNTLLKFPWLAETSDTYLPLLHISKLRFIIYIFCNYNIIVPTFLINLYKFVFFILLS